MFYIEVCLQLGNGLEGLLKVPPKNLQILIYGSPTTSIYTVVFSELKHRRFISFQHTRTSHIYLSEVIMVGFHKAQKLGTDFELCFHFYSFPILNDK